MKYLEYKSIKADLVGATKDNEYADKALIAITHLVKANLINVKSSLFKSLGIVCEKTSNNLSKILYEIEPYLFLIRHLNTEQGKQWLEMNADTKISTSYSCPHCNSNSHKDEHICATELIVPEECTTEGALFLEKLKCSSCNKEYIIENGV